MRKTRLIAVVSVALAAAGCASNSPDLSGQGPGYSGAGVGAGAGGFDAAGGASAGGTLPGTQISDRVLFSVDQSTLSAEAIGTLNAQVGWLTQNPGVPVMIEGHADERGTTEYNLALGSSRASAVRNYMVSRGIPDGRISIITFGRERPLATCAEERCFAQNRRAVTVVTSGLGS